MHLGRVSSLLFALSLVAVPALAQPLGTFRWNVAPYCSVITVNVVQQGAIFTLDGFEDQCGGNPRLPVSGIAVPQPTGQVWIGLTTISLNGNTMHTWATVSLATISGNWRDDGNNEGAFVFSPGPVTGGPRPFPTPLSGLPPSFSFRQDGAWVARGQLNVGDIPITGAGVRSMFFPGDGAFRAGGVEGNQWDRFNVGDYSVAFGLNTKASGFASSAFGSQSEASGGSSIAAGFNSTASGGTSVALGSNNGATAPGAVVIGHDITATGAFSTAMGRFVSTAGFQGSFVYGDNSTTTLFMPNANNQFMVRATGGARFMTALNGNGCSILAQSGNLACTGTINGGSDRTRKQDIVPVDGEDILRKVAAMPVTAWSFTDTPDVRHVGPMAQDFRAAFGLGDSDTSISYTDINGINMRAIQALEARTAALQQDYATLRAELDAIRASLAERRERER